MTRFEKHNPLHPVCAIKVTFKNGDVKRYEFGSHAAKGQAMMHIWGPDVVSIDEEKIGDKDGAR